MPSANDPGAVATVPVAPSAPPPMPAMPQMPSAAPTVEQLQAQLAAAQAAVAAPAVPIPPQFQPPAMPSVAAVPPAMPTMPPSAAPTPPAPVATAPVIPPSAPTAMPPLGGSVTVTAPPAAAPTITNVVPPPFATGQSVGVDPSVSGPVPSPLNNLSQMMDQSNTGGGGLFDRFKGHDLSQVQTNNFRLLPVDVPAYEGRITKFELGQSSTGFPQAKMTVKSYFPAPHAGVSVTTYITLQPNSMWVWKSLLEAAGLLGPQGQCLAEGAACFLGKCVQFQIKHDMYDGAPRNKIAGGFNSPQYQDEVPAANGQSQIQVPQASWPNA